MKRSFLLIGWALSFLFCGLGCGPGVNPGLKAWVDRTTADAGASDLVYSGASPFRPMPWEIGQWALYRTVSNGAQGVLKLSIVGREGNAYWLEVSNTDYHGCTVVQELVAVPNPARSSSARIRRIRVMNGEGKLSEMAVPIGSVYEDPLFILTYSAVLRGDEDVTVPAGTFRQAARGPCKIPILVRRSEGTAWYHSKVPVSGMVKSVSTDGRQVVELLKFSMKGAKASF